MTVDLVVSVTQVSLLPGFFCFGIKHLVEMQTMSIDKDCFMHAWMAIQTGFKVNDVSAAWRGRCRTALEPLTRLLASEHPTYQACRVLLALELLT